MATFLLVCSLQFGAAHRSEAVHPFRDRLIGRTSAFEAEYPGSSPGPGTTFLQISFFQLAHQVVARPHAERHDRQRRILAWIGHKS